MDKKLEINDFASGEKLEITMEIDQGDLIIFEHEGRILNVWLDNGEWGTSIHKETS